MRGEYSTRQRALILEFMKESGSHHTVSDIVEGLKSQGVNIGIATVYRALDRLTATGEVKKFVIDEKSGACYQYASTLECNRHFHLKCIRCGKLIHLSCEFLSEMEKHILQDHGFVVSAGKTVIYGVCNACSLDEKVKDDSQKCCLHECKI